MALQIVTLIITKASLLSVISSLAGIIYVSTLVFKKRYTFLFAMIFNATMLVIGFGNGIYSEIIQQPMFFAINAIGFMHMNSKSSNRQVDKVLDKIKSIKSTYVFAISFLMIVGWSILSFSLGSPIWLKDGLLGGIAISAQVFSISENKYSWYGWMILNGLNVWTWMTLGHAAMAVLYGAYLLNSIVGYIVWSREAKTIG